MSVERLNAFLEKVKDDTSLQEKLKGASDADAVAAIAENAGYKISSEVIEKSMSELTDKELEGLAGGVINQSQNSTVNYNPFVIGTGQVIIGGKIG